jgi:predicted DNA-binding protein (MmcQ/YjbR family)
MPKLLDQIRAAAMKYPEAEKAFLFGDHEVYRVREKVFVWLGEDAQGCWVQVKLKDTGSMALSLPFCEPAGYGMAKYGWVGARFPKGKDDMAGLVLQWVAESYRHTAPKRLLKQLEGGVVTEKKKKAPAKRKKR